MLKKEFIAEYMPIDPDFKWLPVSKMILAWDLEDAFAEATLMIDRGFKLTKVYLMMWSRA